MQILDLLFGKPLASSDERAEHVGPSAGLPIFGLDALSSAAYGPEAALTLLIPLGLAGVHLIVPVSAAIIILLVIVYFSSTAKVPITEIGTAIRGMREARHVCRNRMTTSTTSATASSSVCRTASIDSRTN